LAKIRTSFKTAHATKKRRTYFLFKKKIEPIYMEYFTYIEFKDKMPIQLIIDESEPIEELVVCEKRKANQSHTLILYHLRITFTEDKVVKHYFEDEGLNGQKKFLKEVLKVLRKFTEHWILGVEEFKKGMLPTTPHAHIVFLSKDKKDTIRKALIERHFKLMTGNKNYALKVMPNQTIKEYRYVLKQQKNETARYVQASPKMLEYLKGEYDTDLQKMTDEAYAVWLTACEVADKKDNQDAENKGFQDRLFIYLNQQAPANDLELKISIQKFYIVEEKKPFNKTTATGYFYNYKITAGMMTHEELATKW